MRNIYALADAKHTTVGALMGTDRRRYNIHLPKWLAWLFRRDTLTIEEENEGLTGTELAYWLAYYEINKPKR